jgi:hypothetical protein
MGRIMSKTASNLGRLERVDLRDAWEREADDFTPWLASEENIELLGEAIGIELEVEAEEKRVGPFRADILCKDTATANWVLVENQLEKTDHSHLGQLLTYAAGLEAVTIVWIAKRFTDEHRAALDWLNNVTDESIRFFGLEVELWRIGKSPPAPKFNVVSSPNDWTRTVTEARHAIEQGAISDLKKRYLEFWTEYAERMTNSDCPLKPAKPSPDQWKRFSVGRTGFSIIANAASTTRTILVRISLYPPDSKLHFHALLQRKEEIETAMEVPLDWREMPESGESHIRLVREGLDVGDPKDWPAISEWMILWSTKFDKVFRPIIKDLGPVEDQLPDDE